MIVSSRPQKLSTTVKKLKHEGVEIKLDFEKAYMTNVNRDFLLSLLKAMGGGGVFRATWYGWVINILLDSKVAQIINGEPTSWIVARRGDPLFPLSFIASLW